MDSLEGQKYSSMYGQRVRQNASFSYTSSSKRLGGTRTSRLPVIPLPPQKDPCLTTGSYYEGRWMPEDIQFRTSNQSVIVGYETTIIDMTKFGGSIQTIQVPKMGVVTMTVSVVTYRWQYARFSCAGDQITDWTNTDFTTVETGFYVDDSIAKAVAASTNDQNRVDAFQNDLQRKYQAGIEQMMNRSVDIASAVQRAALQTSLNILDSVQSRIANEAEVEINSRIGDEMTYIDVDFVNDANDLDDRTFTIKGAGKTSTYSVGQTMTGRALIESGIIPDTNSEHIDSSSEYVITHVGLDTSKPRHGVVGMSGTSYPGRITIQVR